MADMYPIPENLPSWARPGTLVQSTDRLEKGEVFFGHGNLEIRSTVCEGVTLSTYLTFSRLDEWKDLWEEVKG